MDGYEGKWGGDVRAGMAAGWGGGRVDYCVACWYEGEGGRLYVLGGNNNGSVGMWHVGRGELRVVWEWVSENGKDYWEVDEKDVNVSIWVEQAEVEGGGGGGGGRGGEGGEEEGGGGGGGGGEERKEGLGEGRRVERKEETAMQDDEEEVGEGGVGGGDEKREALPLHTPGHVATVRDVVWVDGVMLTGGNDGKLCVWSNAPHFRSARPARTSRTRCKSGADMQT